MSETTISPSARPEVAHTGPDLPVLPADVTASEPARRTSVERARRRFVLGLLAIAVVVPPVLAVARAPRWWEWIAPEETPMTWLQSVVLVLACGAAALMSFLLAAGGHPVRQQRIWLVLAAGFGALALDERFAVHERVRDGVLAPRGVTIPFLPWVAPGDFLVLGIAVVGLALLPSVWRAVSSDPAARRLLATGVLLALVAVGMDSIDPSSWSIDAERVQQTVEEVFELAAGLCFLAASGLRLLGHLSSIVSTQPGGAGGAPAT